MSYEMKTPPRACQVEALAALENKTAFALHMAMRTGKSKVVVDDFGRLQAAGKVDDLLLIATGGSYRTWEQQFKDHAGEPLASGLRVLVWESSKAKSKGAKQALAQFKQATGPRCLLINVEALSVVKEAKKACEEFVNSRRCMVVVDESTSIRNPDSKRTEFVLKLGRAAAYRRTLTGLPNPKSPLDIFSQFEFLDPRILGYSTFTAFKHRYAIEERICFVPRAILASKLTRATGMATDDMTSAQIQDELRARKIWFQSVPRIKGFQNEEELRDNMAKAVYRKLLEDCYDLPPKTYIVRHVAWHDEQRRMYDELQSFFTTALAAEDHVTAANAMTCMMKLHQLLCGHAKNEAGEMRVVPQNRVRSLLELLDEHEGKAIIWCSYDADIRNVSEAIAEHTGKAVARFWGGNRATREDEERAFLNDASCPYMVATASAGGKGRTWTVADLVVYYSNTPDLEHRVQSEERAQAVGKTQSVAYVDLVVPDSVDEKYLHALRHKLNLASVVNGDNWREWVV